MAKTHKARNQLAMEHLAWAHDIAWEVAKKLPTWFRKDDLLGPAELALLHAAQRFDRRRGVSFRSYAVRRVRGACWDAIRRREYREHEHESLSDTFFLDRRGAYYVDDPAPEEWLHDRAPSPEAVAATNQLREVWPIVQRLPARHAAVILCVYGGSMTLEALSDLVEVGPARLSQIHREALTMLAQRCGGLVA